MIRRIAFSLFAILLAGGVAAVNLTDAQRAAVEERIRPVGESCLVGDSTCAVEVAAAASSGPRSGEEVYNAACMACHSTGAGGAPITGDVAVWADRIALGMEVLYAHGVDGIPGTGMMAKGGCMACTDEEIHAAVDYMVAASQ